MREERARPCEDFITLYLVLRARQGANLIRMAHRIVSELFHRITLNIMIMVRCLEIDDNASFVLQALS